MSQMPPDDLGDFSMLELFRVEAETQVAALTAGLLDLERDPVAAKPLEALMRAAHSLKGAARIVNLPVVARLAHALEECFVAAQQGKIRVGKNETTVLLRTVDFFASVAKLSETQIVAWEESQICAVEELLAALNAVCSAKGLPLTPADGTTEETVASPGSSGASPQPQAAVVRLTAENVNRLMGLAGESLVESRRLQPLTVSMQRLKRLQSELATALDGLRQSLAGEPLAEQANGQLTEMAQRLAECQQFLTGRIEELETFDRVSARTASRLYQEVLQCRMRPFGDGVRQFPRMIRDLAHALGKEVRLEIKGESTQVDRDILEKLDAPLTHLLRNAVDHGCEFPDERVRQKKPEEAVVRLEARHSAGILLVSVADDGRGIDLEKLRAAVVEKKLVTEAVADKLSEPELLDFLFLPGFTLKETVTEISGRGVGLDVVRDMVKAVRGKIHIAAQPGKGARFQLQLPITLSVIRALLVEVAGEPYAIPLAQVAHTLKLPRGKVQSLEGRRYFEHDGGPVRLVAADQVLELTSEFSFGEELAVVVLGERGARCGLVVDKFLAQRELVVQPLDARLGKVRDISAAATLEDGSPVLILDVDDVVRSAERLMSAGGLIGEKAEPLRAPAKVHRILIVDDSPTVREFQRRFLSEHGFLVEVAVDGVDGWNALRTGNFDLAIVDVDMPRMDGLELTALIRKDARLRTLPVLMVSHKDRAEDRQRGIAAGANEYLTKSGFEAKNLLQTIQHLICPHENKLS
jgi:two-component system sensor histidine kinase and response regulator WspE